VIAIMPLTGIGEVASGTDLAQLLIAAMRATGASVEDGAVLVVTQKIVSKAEGCFVDLADVTPGEAALELADITGKDARLVELVLRESEVVLRAVPDVLITRHRLGLVMANAGIDRSNLGPGSQDRVLLLPVDPDASARGLADRLSAAFGCRIAVVLSDSFGRPWRNGVTNVAIGAAGLVSLVDRRGQHDRDGRPLEVTQVALADMIASAAGLATGEGSEGIPAVLISGLHLDQGDRPAHALIRPLDEDLFQ
jgi:coenzyme F420-0:L-glutamate ligase/coenzyme F420-1:gamma-L-glutamate ligase